MKVARRRRDGRRESNKHQTFVISPSVIFDKMTAIALLRYPDFVYAAWSAAQNRPLRQQMLPLSATGGGRICCPSEGALSFVRFESLCVVKAEDNNTHYCDCDCEIMLPRKLFLNENSAPYNRKQAVSRDNRRSHCNVL